MIKALKDEIEKQNLEIIEVNFKGNLKGLYSDNTIALDSKIETENERNCVLAEEIGHYYTSYGDITDQKNIKSIKQEKRARNWGYEKLVNLLDLICAFEKGLRSKTELADYLNITEEFLEKAIKHYKEKYGVYHEINNYIIYFEPNLIILKMF
ncbi:ImmA/IrrE family metallo-endopeptidase [Clostridium neuense]|uniref:ImmA/IrrE family metallo-endopeptidase n=1 Tax=Clostridium neuense TaxID=1728934 RepID=A0ABW8T8K1_9CLOT